MNTKLLHTFNTSCDKSNLQPGSQLKDQPTLQEQLPDSDLHNQWLPQWPTPGGMPSKVEDVQQGSCTEQEQEQEDTYELT